MSKEINAARLAELKKIESKHKGVLHPRDVVSTARNEKSALHSYFDWDDKSAAAKHRLEQARSLITEFHEIHYVDHTPYSVPVYTSLHTDRKEGKGGYRRMERVLKTRTGREELLETALWELSALERKYKSLHELTAVFEAARQIRKEFDIAER